MYASLLKAIKNKQMNISSKILLLFLFISSSTCEKGFEDLNKNPFEPTQVAMGSLFNGVIESLQLGGEEQLYLHNEYLYEITQQGALTAKTFQNFNIGTEDIWKDYYATLANIREIEGRFEAYEGEEEALANVKSMLKVVLAYKTFRLTDLFGDIPFSEAGGAFISLNNLEPKFDKQEDIYKFLLQELAWVNENINVFPNPETASGEAYLSFAGFDHLFDNDMRLWQKFANSLRLRHALRMSQKDPDFALPILKEILENNLPVIEKGEDVLLSPSLLSWKKTSTSWSFREHKKLRLGSNIWHQMSDSDALDGSGIFDPRAAIFFEPNNANEWAPFPQIADSETPASGGSPYQHQRDLNYSFKGNSNIYAPFNYYLTRDEDYVPEILLTAAEVSFLKAEIYLRGLGVAENISEAEGEYTLGVVNSMTFWQNIFINTPIWENKPPVLSEGNFFQIVNHPRISIFGSSDKLSLVYAQRWIDAFRQPWEAYALTRRTDATPREGDRPIHYRFSYPPSEVANNPNNWEEQVMKMGEDTPQTKIWWME